MPSSQPSRGRPKLWPKDFGRGVKLYKTERGNGRVIYQLADPSQGKRQIRQFTDESAAIAEAQRIANLIASGEAYAAGMRSEDRASFGRAMKALEGLSVPLEIAATMFADAVAKLGSKEALPLAVDAWIETHAKITPIQVSKAVEHYLETKKATDASKRYREDLSSRLGRLKSSFTGTVDSITTAKLQAWMDDQRLSAQSIRNFKTVFVGFFKHARSRGWCASNPAEGLTVPRVKTDSETETFTVEEFSRLLHAAKPDFLPCLVLGGFCGLRSAEIERLHWEDVRLAEGEVVIKRGTAKTKSRRIVPLGAAAKQWLAPYATKTGPIWTGTHEDFYEGQSDTAKAAGIAWKANGLRHGYATHRLAETGDAVRVAHEMGNSAAVVHSHYKSLVSESDGKAWFAILPSRPTNVMPLPGPESQEPTQAPATTAR